AARRPATRGSRRGPPRRRRRSRPSPYTPLFRSIAGLTSRQRPSRSTIAMPMPDAAIATRKQSSPVAVVGLVADWGIGSRTGFRWSVVVAVVTGRCIAVRDFAMYRTMPSMDLGPFTLQQVMFLLILAGGLYLFVSERLRIDVSAMLVLLAL